MTLPILRTAGAIFGLLHLGAMLVTSLGDFNQVDCHVAVLLPGVAVATKTTTRTERPRKSRMLLDAVRCFTNLTKGVRFAKGVSLRPK